MEDARVDPHIRLQNIALESAELQAQRQMSWSEVTNRASAFMTIVGASVFGLALVGNATGFSRDFLLVVLLVLPVLLLIGISTVGRMGELDTYDWRLIQGLNRLRHLRVDLDPSFAPYLVTSIHDDVYSVLSSYGDSGSAFHSLWTLVALIGTIIAVLAAFTAATLGLLVGFETGTVIVLGIAAFLVTTVLPAIWAYRGFKSTAARMTVLFPAVPTPDGAEVTTAPATTSGERLQP